MKELFPRTTGEITRMPSRQAVTTEFIAKPRIIKPQEVFDMNVPIINPECLNKIKGGISYAKGELYWKNECSKLITLSVARLGLGPNEKEKAEEKLKNELEERYYEATEFVEKYAQARGPIFYRQKILRHEELRDVRATCNLGLAALEESEKETDENKRKELESSGFILLQIADLIVKKTKGIYVHDPFPAFASKQQYAEKGEQNLKKKKAKNKESKKMHTTHVAKEDVKEFTLLNYAEKLEFWTNKYIERFGSDEAPQEEEFKRIFTRDLRASGGDKDFKVDKVRPEILEEAIRSKDNFSSYALYLLALSALYNPYKKYSRRSEKAGFELIGIAYGKATDDPAIITRYKGFYEFVFKKTYLSKKSKVEPKGHAVKKEMSAMIGRYQSRLHTLPF